MNVAMDLAPGEVHPAHKPSLPSHDAIKASPHYPVIVTPNAMVTHQVCCLVGSCGEEGAPSTATPHRWSDTALTPPSLALLLSRAVLQTHKQPALQRRRRPGQAPRAQRRHDGARVRPVQGHHRGAPARPAHHQEAHLRGQEALLPDRRPGVFLFRRELGRRARGWRAANALYLLSFATLSDPKNTTQNPNNRASSSAPSRRARCAWARSLSSPATCRRSSARWC